MSSSSSDNGDPPAVMSGGDPDYPAGRLVSSTAEFGRPGRGAAPNRAAAVRAPEERDPRLRGLQLEPTDHVPTPPAQTDSPRGRRYGPLLAKVGILLALAALVVLLLQAYVIQPFSVPGNAMTPTLQAGDRIVVVKSDLLEGPIHSGQIVVFHPPTTLPCRVVGARGGDLVLRVVALPGETIWSLGETIFVDGRPLREQGWYNPRFGQVGSTPILSTTLARGQYFVLADNRSNACDSRVFGPISKSSIVGVGIAIVARQGHVVFRKL
jgi:signal peptidase I